MASFSIKWLAAYKLSGTPLPLLSCLKGYPPETEYFQPNWPRQDGQEFSECTTIPKGEPVNKPLTRDEIIAKFEANVDFSQAVTKDNAEKALRLLEKLEELDNVNKIVELLITKH